MSDKQLTVVLRRMKKFFQSMADDRALTQRTRDGLAEYVKAAGEAAKRLSTPRRPQA